MVIKKASEAKYKTKVLDHLGLIAGMCKELDIAGLIDNAIPNTSADKILSTGNAVVGMILNGLGFVNKRLYLVSHFFKNKPVDKLLDVSYLDNSHFNDDALGRALDAVYDYGAEKLYSLISHYAIDYLSKHYNLEVYSGQLDNTNFHLHSQEKHLELKDGQVLSITKGYSKDHRPDLVQIGLQLIVENKSKIPLLMKVLSGNEEEAKSYGAFIKTYTEQLNKEYGVKLIVVDSKLYNQANLSILSTKGNLKWVTRVPNQLNVVKDLITHIDKSSFQDFQSLEHIKNEQDEVVYQYQVVCNNYGGVQQRWLVLFSETKYQRDLKQLDKRLLKATKADKKSLKKLTQQSFETQQAALTAALDLSKNMKYNNLEDILIVTKKHYNKVGKPKKGQQPDSVTYQVKASLGSDEQKYEAEKQKIGYFILATNELDEQLISVEELVKHYKNQYGVEKSFKFLKDPNIVASSLFVQKPERMIAIMMIMTLCLLVYSALEYVTRVRLKQENLSFPNQQGKPIQNPTMKWIFEYFEGIHILYTSNNQRFVLNMDDQGERKKKSLIYKIENS